MKTMQKLLFCAAMILITSCSESPDKMLTIIHSDGSCQRIFSAYADPTFMLGDTADRNNPFPVEIDSTYNIVWQYKDGEMRTDFPISKALYDSLFLDDTTKRDIPKKEKDFLVFASQNFKSVKQMAKEFTLKPSHPWKDLDIQYHFEKKIRFFYTYFSYKETYLHIALPFDEPIENYMSKKEASFWFTGEPNLVEGMNGIEMQEYISDLNKKHETWVAKNMWNEQYKILVRHYDIFDNPSFSKEELANSKDTIFQSFTVSEEFDLMASKMSSFLDKYFKTNVFEKLWEMENSPVTQTDEEFERQISTVFFGNRYYQLIMPGEVLSTNGVNRNDTLNWNLTAYRMAHGNYSIEAQSRKLNIWMIALTAIFAITAVVIFVYRKKKA